MASPDSAPEDPVSGRARKGPQAYFCALPIPSMHAVKEVTAGCPSMERYLALLVLLLVLDIAQNRAETLGFSKACRTFDKV